QENTHPDYTTGRGGNGTNTVIWTYTFDEAFSYFVPSLWGAEHTIKTGFSAAFNTTQRFQPSSGTFDFGSNLPYDPNNPATRPREFTILVGPSGTDYMVEAEDRNYAFFFEDRMRLTDNFTLN